MRLNVLPDESGEMPVTALDSAIAQWQGGLDAVLSALCELPEPWLDDESAAAHKRVNQAFRAASERLCELLLPEPGDDEPDDDEVTA